MRLSKTSVCNSSSEQGLTLEPFLPTSPQRPRRPGSRRTAPGHQPAVPTQALPTHSRLPENQDLVGGARGALEPKRQSPEPPEGQRRHSPVAAVVVLTHASAPPRGLSYSATLRAETRREANQRTGPARMSRPGSYGSQSQNRGRTTRRHSNQLASSLRPALFHREKSRQRKHRLERVGARPAPVLPAVQ